MTEKPRILFLKSRLLRLTFVYFAVAICEVALHGILAVPQFRWLSEIYLQRWPNGGASVFPDLLLPACLLGYWNGFYGKENSVGKAALFSAGLAAGIVALYPLYTSFFDKGLLWWWTTNMQSNVLLLFMHFSIALMCILFFTAGLQKKVAD